MLLHILLIWLHEGCYGGWLFVFTILGFGGPWAGARLAVVRVHGLAPCGGHAWERGGEIQEPAALALVGLCLRLMG